VKPVDLPGEYLVLDLGNACPLRCKHCIQSEPQRHRHFDTWGTMDVGLALGLLDELERERRRFHALILFWLGEPLNHPAFHDIYIRALGAAAAGVFHRIEVHTNAVLLTREIAEAVVGCRGARQRWHFSLDAATARTYREIKGRDCFDQVEAHVRDFLRLRDRDGNDELKVAFQYIPQWGNEREAPAFVDRWRRELATLGCGMEVQGRAIPEDAGDCVFFRQLDALDGDRQDSANRLFGRVLRRTGVDPAVSLRRRARERMGAFVRRRRPDATPEPCGPVTCACPFLSPIVHWDGRLTVCTRDSALSLSPGSLEETSFHEIWWESDRLRDLRDAHLRGDAGGLCADCPIPRSANYTGLSGSDLQRFVDARGGR